MSAPFAHLLSIAAAVALPAWRLVGVGNSVEVTTTAHALVEPAGVQEGDLLVACIASRIASATQITLPSGWTRGGQQNANNILTTSSALPSATMAYIIRGSAAPALTFTHPAAAAPALGRIVAYRGVAPASTADVTSAGTTATNITAVSLAGVTTTIVEDLIVALAAGGQEAAWSSFNATTPSGASGATDTTTQPGTTWIERADVQTTTGNDTSLGIFDAIKQVAGATGNFTATASVAAGHSVISGAFKRVTTAWDPHRLAPNLALSVSNTRVTQNGTNVFAKVGAVHGHSKGKYYFEVTLNTNIDGNFGVGVMNAGDFTIADANSWCGILPGQAAWYPLQNQVYHFNGSIGAVTGSSAVSGNVIQIAYDIDAKLFWCRLQGANWNGSGTANPATGAGGLSMANIAGIIVACVTIYTNGQSCTINAGGSPFATAPPSGYKPAGVP